MNIERAATYNPLTVALHRRWTVPQLLRLDPGAPGGRALDVGCGRGVSTEVLASQLGPAEIHAFDVDPVAVGRARRRLDGRVPAVRRVSVADATAIDEPADSFDTVFELFVIHNIPGWRRAIREVARVLRPGGRFYFGEHTRAALERRWSRALFENPEEGFFTPEEWCGELARHGLVVGDNYRVAFRGIFFLGVARFGGSVSALPLR